MQKEVKHSERAHARLSASGSDRWINCPASPALEDGFPEETTSYAEEGTLAHEFAERMLKVDLKLMKMSDYREQIEELKKHPLYYHDLQEEVSPYVTYVKEQFAEAKRIDPKAKIFIEQKFNLEKYVKDGFGTGDSAILYDQFLEVPDLKFGKGKEVKAKHNPQLKYYALGVLETLTPAQRKAIKVVKLTIVQPRMNNINSWNIPADMLLKWGDDVLRPKALATEDPNAEAVAGDWCQYCKARAKCRALYDLGMEIGKQDFEIKLDPRLLSDEELFEVYLKADFINKWLDHVRSIVLKEAIMGKKWPGYKLVEGRTSRQWKNEALVVDVLEQNLYESEQFTNSKLKSIADLEKLIGKAKFSKLLDPLMFKPEGAPTLVDEEDKREEFGKNQAEKDFGEYTDYEDLDEDDDPFK